ncbi:hypothetical protein NQ315_013914 [Exocentrus adspersus]|uniref:Ribosomal protein L7Ae/L30e/S12e/Gadd45 domain-containing protein n=1 Tax=Exocentrus adspersus TaxID=1586481 RepID=A0AAV8VRF0_9CUCU|nr:hypothetical protein NQ315_013914 [Exocentrus adspersus]
MALSVERRKIDEFRAPIMYEDALALLRDVIHLAKGTVQRNRSSPDLTAKQLSFRAVRSPRIKSILVVECADALKWARQREAELVWVPECMEIQANERVDQLASLGPKELCEELEPILGITRGKVVVILMMAHRKELCKGIDLHLI